MAEFSVRRPSRSSTAFAWRNRSRFRYARPIAAPLVVLLAGLFSRLSAGTLTNAAVNTYNVRVGTETFAGLYKFTTNTLLVETAEAITNMGSDVIKFYMGTDTSGQSGVTLPSNVTNLMTLARDCPSYHQVLDMPFRHLVMWAYPFANGDNWWANGYNATQGAADYQEMYQLTRYLLTNYNNSGKTFYLGHWEGDGYLDVNNWSTNPSPVTIQGMIGWLNNRQQAVDDAKRATAYTNVSVFNYAEANRVRDAMLNGSNNNQRVINYVVPYVTNLDFLSYSSYDAQNLDTADLYSTLNYMQSMLPTNKASDVPGERMWIGEYGWGYMSTAAQEPLDREYIQRLLGWSYQGQCLPFILFWEMYSNYNPNGATNFCLIDYTGTKVPSWYLQNYFFNDARMLVAQFNESNNRLPTDTEFSSMVSPLLNAPLSAPVALAVTNIGASVTTNTSAAVSGVVAQGIYGDVEAGVWLYYGLEDGGTNTEAWQDGRFAGFDTNFNPATFTVVLNNLVPNTNYYYRFFASNPGTTFWAQASSQFSTVTLNPPDYGSRLKISFPGYSGGETLHNFPALINLGTNLPGFSYRQFASPAGGDLRFTDAGGSMLIPHEIDEWNTNGTSPVWVSVPSLSATNFVWAYWGNPAAAIPPPYSTNGSVWAGYDLVWHLKQGGFPYADSTLRHPALSGVAPIQTNGIVGHGESFNGLSTFLDAGAVDVANAFTLSAWVNVAPSAGNIQGIWVNQQGGFGSAGFAWFVDHYNTTNKALLVDTGDGTNGSEISTPTNSVAFGMWHQLAVAIDRLGGTATFYLDGALVGSGPVVPDFDNDADLNLGRFTNNVYYFDGAMDETRIQSGVQSSNWIWASWMTVASNSTLEDFAAVGQVSPSLAINAGAAAGPVLSWPASGVGFAVYATTNLAPPVTWTLAAGQPVFTNNQWQAALPADGDVAQFYCLKAQ
jgi:hypothetical protein